ncbi:MAG: hypothetical protein QM778_16270 [Myxococcales bacterium]
MSLGKTAGSTALAFWVLWLLASCGDPPHEAPEPELDSASEELQVELSKRALAFPIATRKILPAGIAGDHQVLFVGVPLEGKVAVLSRFGNTQIGELPPPPAGFVLPFIMHRIGPRRLAVLDAGGLPSPAPFVPANPRIYEYSYGLEGGFHARLERTISFEQELVGFAEDIVSLGEGRYVLSDAILGALWLVESDGSIVPGVMAQDPAPGTGIEQLRMCPDMPLIEVGGVPFLFSGSTLPGVSPLAVRHGQLYFYSPCAEGLYALPVDTLFDDRTPEQRAEDIVLVSPKPANVVVEQLLGLAFDPSRPGECYVYAADSLQLRMIRIDVSTGARQLLADDPELFNFPSSTAFLPPILGHSQLVVVSNQQQLTPITNDASEGEMFDLPFLITELSLRAKRNRSLLPVALAR